MHLTPEDLHRTTLLRQGLLSRSRLPVAGAVRRFGPLQSQNAATPYLALWNRIGDFEPSELDDAYRSNQLAKASLLRLTLHTVCADDHANYRAAMLPSLRRAGLGDRRFTSTGLSVDDADRLIERLGGLVSEPRTRNEIEHEITNLLGYEPAGGLWRALRLIAPWRHHPGDHPWSFGDPARFVEVELEQIDHADAVALVIRRYLAAFGPATRQDIGQFTILRLAVVDDVLDSMEDLVRHEGPGGATYDLADHAIATDIEAAPPRLLPMWDNALLADADRSRMIPEKYRPHVIRRNGDVLPTVLVDGRVAGVWRHVDDGIEVAAFHDLTSETLSALEPEAVALDELISERDPTTYRRHHHWWDSLPTVPRTSFRRP